MEARSDLSRLNVILGDPSTSAGCMVIVFVDESRKQQWMV